MARCEADTKWSGLLGLTLPPATLRDTAMGEPGEEYARLLSSLSPGLRESSVWKVCETQGQRNVAIVAPAATAHHLQRPNKCHGNRNVPELSAGRLWWFES